MKDPAMLWYWNDWQGGTSTLSRHLKGCYIDILHAQFNSGPLSLEEIKTVLGSDFGLSWPTLQKKFKTDEAGLFFNERMEQERAKRQAFSDSRRKNREGKKKTSKTSEKHMYPHMENENRNIITDSKVEEYKASTSVGITFEMLQEFKISFPDYPADNDKDLPACLKIANAVADARGWPKSDVAEKRSPEIKTFWKDVVAFVAKDEWFSTKSISFLADKWQDVIQKFNNHRKRNTQSGKKMVN